MHLTTKCKSCNAPIEKTVMVDDRIQLAQKWGDEFSLNCQGCYSDSIYQPDDLKAIGNVKKRLIVLGICVGLSFLSGVIVQTFLAGSGSFMGLWHIIAYLTPLLFFSFYWKYDMESIRRFNHLKYRARQTNVAITNPAHKVHIAKTETIDTSMDGGSV
jgi:hypothetical protein